MTHYFFDLHGDSLTTWDDIGADLADNAEIVPHATALLDEALKSVGGNHVVATVHCGDGKVICTVTVSRGAGPKINWAAPERARMC